MWSNEQGPLGSETGRCAVSLWLSFPDKTGRVHYYAVEVPFFLLPVGLGVTVALLLAALVDAPVATMLTFFSIALGGFLLLAAAKLSVILRGRLISFGSAQMHPAARAIYRAGYVLMAVGSALTLASIALVSRM